MSFQNLLKKTSQDDFKKFTSISGGKISINSVTLFNYYYNKTDFDFEILEFLKFLEQAAIQSCEIQFSKKLHQGAINNCMGRWFELVFFHKCEEYLDSKDNSSEIKQIVKLPSANRSFKFVDLFVPEEQKILKSINPATSNPDFLLLNKKIPWPEISNTWQLRFQNTSFYGRIKIEDISVVISIKTSARPDRRYQQLYEANLIKALAIRFNKKIKFVTVALHENEKNDEVYSSSSILSIVLNEETLRPTIDSSIVLTHTQQFKKLISDLSK